MRDATFLPQTSGCSCTAGLHLEEGLLAAILSRIPLEPLSDIREDPTIEPDEYPARYFQEILVVSHSLYSRSLYVVGNRMLHQGQCDHFEQRTHENIPFVGQHVLPMPVLLDCESICPVHAMSLLLQSLVEPAAQKPAQLECIVCGHHLESLLLRNSISCRISWNECGDNSLKKKKNNIARLRQRRKTTKYRITMTTKYAKAACTVCQRQ